MKNIFKYCAIAFVLLSDFAIYAQPEDPLGEDPQPAPINSKLILLALLGVVYILYIFRKNKRIV
jgi:hypothetical protein